MILCWSRGIQGDSSEVACRYRTTDERHFGGLWGGRHTEMAEREISGLGWTMMLRLMLQTAKTLAAAVFSEEGCRGIVVPVEKIDRELCRNLLF